MNPPSLSQAENSPSPKAQSEETPASMVLTLTITKKIPSFKTGKRGTIAETADGKKYGRVVTSREDRARMKEIIHDIELQLLSAYHRDPQTQTGNTVPLWIASCVPLNDSAAWIKSFTVEVEDEIVEEGQELATITIEQI